MTLLCLCFEDKNASESRFNLVSFFPESRLGVKEIEGKPDIEISALSSTLFPISFPKLVWHKSEEISSFPFTVFRLTLENRISSELTEVKFATSGSSNL